MSTQHTGWIRSVRDVDNGPVFFTFLEDTQDGSRPMLIVKFTNRNKDFLLDRVRSGKTRVRFEETDDLPPDDAVVYNRYLRETDFVNFLPGEQMRLRGFITD